MILRTCCKSIIFTIISIATQAIITPATANIMAVNSNEKKEISVAQELAAIKQEKLVIDTNLKKQEAACYKKFAVNDCLKDAKIDAQTALGAIKRREIAINDSQRKAKIESDLGKKERAAEKTAAGNKAGEATTDTAGNNAGNIAHNGTGEKAVEAKEKTKTVKTSKLGRSIKSDAEILTDKNAADKARTEAAQKRLLESNRKQVASQKKAQIRAAKNSQVAVNTAKYNQKLAQAEAHKQALENARSAKNKAQSAPLPIPTITTP